MNKPREIFANWCSENNVDPQYKFYDEENVQRVKCEVAVHGYNYTGIGISETKRSAQKEATKDFILFLVYRNILPPIPKKKKVKKETENSGVGLLSIKIDKVKNVDFKSVAHGICTIDDPAKKELKQYIVSNENSVIDMSIFDEELTEKQNKYLSTQKKKEKKQIFCNVHDVKVNEKLMNDVYNLLEELNIKPIANKNTVVMNENKTLIFDQVPELLRKCNVFSSARVIPWCPPQSNWNPWLAIHIHKAKSLTQISNMMKKKFAEKQRSFTFQKRIEDRAKLPIFNKKHEILDIIRDNPVVIVQGGTGCGKTTQVCQFILDEYIDAKKGAYCNIICTQPRKIPAISIANRVAFERAEAIGKSVGYVVRFDCVNPQPFGSILFCTVEILIRKLKKGLFGISHVIIDEIHERCADNEFLLIILKDMVQKYPDLRMILMSANANLKLFNGYFNNCPVIDVEGRCYPVKEYFLEDIVQMLNYKPVIEKKTPKKKMNTNLINFNSLVSNAYSDEIKLRVSMINEDSHHLAIIESLLTYIETDLNMVGAVLVFLPGWTWIIELRDYLLKNTFIAENYSILPLHSILSRAEQNKVFKPVPSGIRKVILSTNIAETSITIEDVVFVIDYGKEKLVEFSDNITKFDTVWVSKVNVEQRKGRVGRVQAGFCFYLYTKERFNNLNDNISSKLKHCSLSHIGLTIKYLHLGDIGRYLKKAIDPPSSAAVKDTIALLEEIKCLEKNGDITSLGCILAQLPVEPRFGRMMVLGNIFMLGDSLSTIAAGSSIDYDLFIEDNGQNIAKHNFSGNRFSDQLAFLNAFMHCDLSNENCNSIDVDYFNENNLSIFALKTIRNIKNQIMDKFMKFGFPKCCFEMQDFDFGITGIFEKSQLDMLPALLTMAYYPLVYCYKEKRKVKLKNENFALISKSSVNCPRMKSEDKFQSPFFVFEKQINLTCVNSTMVSPIHLLLFGARKVEYSEHLIVLDNWIYLKMDIEVAAAIVALRPAINNLILKVTDNPKLILKPCEIDLKLINILKSLCNFNAGKTNLSPITFDDKFGNNKKKSKDADAVNKSSK